MIIIQSIPWISAVLQNNYRISNLKSRRKHLHCSILFTETKRFAQCIWLNMMACLSAWHNALEIVECKTGKRVSGRVCLFEVDADRSKIYFLNYENDTDDTNQRKGIHYPLHIFGFQNWSPWICPLFLQMWAQNLYPSPAGSWPDGAPCPLMGTSPAHNPWLEVGPHKNTLHKSCTNSIHWIYCWLHQSRSFTICREFTNYNDQNVLSQSTCRNKHNIGWILKQPNPQTLQQSKWPRKTTEGTPKKRDIHAYPKFSVLKIQNQTEGIQQMRATKKQTYFTMNAEILKQLDCNGKDMKISCNEFTN